RRHRAGVSRDHRLPAALRRSPLRCQARSADRRRADRAALRDLAEQARGDKRCQLHARLSYRAAGRAAFDRRRRDDRQRLDQSARRPQPPRCARWRALLSVAIGARHRNRGAALTKRAKAGIGITFDDAWLIGGVRTPFVDYNGALAQVSPIDLGIKVARDVLALTATPPPDVGTAIARSLAQA